MAAAAESMGQRTMRPRRMSSLWLLLVLGACLTSVAHAAPTRLMAIGDSITEGGRTFSTYRPLLAELLRREGLDVEWVGSRESDGLRHEGYGGKNAEYLAAHVPARFAATPANIVLLHAGHNHTAEENPVPGIVAATERLVAGLRVARPRVTILLAQVIPSGKLPKYSYLPALNAELARLAGRLHTADSAVLLVDQASGFDWRTDTIADHVHPNAAGAAKMATRWFSALQPLLVSTSPGALR